MNCQSYFFAHRSAQRFIAFVFFLLMVQSSFGQTPKKLKEISIGEVERVSVDRLGNLFLVFRNGSIKKYDPNGKVLASLKEKAAPTMIEPWFHPRIFCYHRKTQKIIYYDHNIESPQEEQIDSSVAISPFLACPTNDNKFLILDEADWSLKRVQPGSDKVLMEFNIDTTGLHKKPSFNYLREYQNLIFLHDPQAGIFIFNNLGKKVNQLKVNTNNFGFFGEELFYLVDDKIVFFDLYTEKYRDQVIGRGKFAIVTDERIFLVDDKNKLLVFEYITIPDEK
jgi:hypothetical protein